MKKLCVVSDVIGNRDVIHNDVNGYVCHNADEFVRIIESLQGKNVSGLIEKAYNDILAQYNTVVMANKYGEIYMNKITAQNSQGETVRKLR